MKTEIKDNKIKKELTMVTISKSSRKVARMKAAALDLPLRTFIEKAILSL